MSCGSSTTPSAPGIRGALGPSRSRKRDGCLSKFFQADEREPTVDMQSIQGAFDHRSQVRRGDVERHIKEKSQLVATSEDPEQAFRRGSGGW